MDFSKDIVNFVSEQVGGIIIIAGGSSEIVYADSFFSQKYGSDIVGHDADEIFTWMSECPELSVGDKAVEWECIDTDSKKYYKFNSASFEKDEKIYNIHQIIDITEYMGLNRDITKYMSFFKKLSGFQTAVLEKLSDTYYELLPMLVDYFKTSKAYFFLEREDNMDIVTYSKMGNTYANDRIKLSDAAAMIFDMNTDDDILFENISGDVQDVLKINGSAQGSSYRYLCSGKVSDQRYAIYLNVWPNMDVQSINDKTLISVIKLYAENAIMREKLIYDTEHDHLTGLYNKGKYLEMIEKVYPEKTSLAVFNFDVNNLKKLNDTKGHEAGDKLIIKAANSIRKLTDKKIHGYRIGGDEFLMIAYDLSEVDADELRVRWEKELARLNSIDDDIECIMAVGVCYGSGENLDEICKKADELMYADKKKKKAGDEIR